MEVRRRRHFYQYIINISIYNIYIYNIHAPFNSMKFNDFNIQFLSSCYTFTCTPVILSESEIEIEIEIQMKLFPSICASFPSKNDIASNHLACKPASNKHIFRLGSQGYQVSHKKSIRLIRLWSRTSVRDGPLLVINGVITLINGGRTPISGVIILLISCRGPRSIEFKSKENNLAQPKGQGFSLNVGHFLK